MINPFCKNRNLYSTMQAYPPAPYSPPGVSASNAWPPPRITQTVIANPPCLLADGVPFTLGMTVYWYSVRSNSINSIKTDPINYKLYFRYQTWLVNGPAVIGLANNRISRMCSTAEAMGRIHIDSELKVITKDCSMLLSFIDTHGYSPLPEYKIPLQQLKSFLEGKLVTAAVDISETIVTTSEYFCPECQNTGQVTLLTTVDKCRNSLCKHSV